MESLDRSNIYCIVGAGSSGLTVAKNMLECGISVEVIEREDDVGGNWYFGKPASSVCRSTHLLSSKRMTEFTDFPMPEEYPDYPGVTQVWEYLRSYARHFDLYRVIEFNRSIEQIEPAGKFWDVTLDGGERRRYRGVVIANGHNWDPKFPEYPGAFDGRVLHSAQYKTPDAIRDKRVLVVGAGNSGCDIAVEAAQNAAKAFHSSRRGYHYLPKYFLGQPSDALGERLLRWRVPLALRRMVASVLAKLVLGSPQDYGLRKPDHKLLESHPIVNSQMLYYVGHGDITVKPDIAELCGTRVRFVDGSEEEIDVIVYATGFKISFPFIDREHLNWHDNKPRLYLHIFHPQYDNLFVAGLLQPDSGQLGLVDYQAQVIAEFVATQARAPERAERVRKIKSGPQPDLGAGIHYVQSTRHLLEIEHYTYRQQIKRLMRILVSHAGREPQQV
jgi:cation diffusion facilitator CzcD-associated flavoprotein CzcO